MLVKARDLIDRFHAMIRKKAAPDLEPWITDADISLLASFASGIRRDHAAIKAAIAEPWSNGQSSGLIIVHPQGRTPGEGSLLRAV